MRLADPIEFAIAVAVLLGAAVAALLIFRFVYHRITDVDVTAKGVRILLFGVCVIRYDLSSISRADFYQTTWRDFRRLPANPFCTLYWSNRFQGSVVVFTLRTILPKYIVATLRKPHVAMETLTAGGVPCSAQTGHPPMTW